ncbi:alpha/beta hydrolase [Pararhizobium sp. IMCC21322]|uniref:RBBP9/YdeN family alpha/beta hydrolase n=1 Tax=Pararhizobium sp. IMCC21322 TaxID=3067903 RepID=UPI00274131B4|nr:alpha/beta hydrolase [Pararhizobium sp. IMCC21322]
MKTGELDILILPGLGGGTENHWYRRWNSKLKTARIVDQENWLAPDRDAWTNNIVAAAKSADRPVFMIAHSLGAAALTHAAPHLSDANVVGAMLVAMPDLTTVQELIPETDGFLPASTAPLSFPSLMVASRNDFYCSYQRAEETALDLGSLLIDAGEQGHINDESGHGPWPEGLMALSKFLTRI